MRHQAFTLWANPDARRALGETHAGESGWCAIIGVTVLWRIVRSIIGSQHSLMLPHRSGTRTYSPARRAD